MKAKVIAIISVLLIFTACNKDKFQSKPTLKLKSVGSTSISQGENFVATLEYTDKEGDVDSILYVIRERLNVRGQRTVSDDYDVPEFPNKSKGEIQVTLEYSIRLTQGFTAIQLPGGLKQNDTMNIKFVLKDRAKNLSDTVVVSNVIITR